MIITCPSGFWRSAQDGLVDGRCPGEENGPSQDDQDRYKAVVDTDQSLSAREGAVVPTILVKQKEVESKWSCQGHDKGTDSQDIASNIDLAHLVALKVGVFKVLVAVVRKSIVCIEEGSSPVEDQDCSSRVTFWNFEGSSHNVPGGYKGAQHGDAQQHGQTHEPTFPCTTHLGGGSC